MTEAATAASARSAINHRIRVFDRLDRAEPGPSPSPTVGFGSSTFGGSGTLAGAGAVPTVALLRKPLTCGGREAARFVASERIEDDRNGRFVAHSRIDHQVKAVPSRPIHIEVFADEVGAITIHSFDQLDG